MTHQSKQWELVLMKVSDLNNTFKAACGNKIKADRRFYKFKGKKSTKAKKKEEAMYTYLPKLRLDWAVKGNWSAGALVDSDEFSQLNQMFQVSQQLRLTRIFNPFTAEKTTFGQNPLKINRSDIKPGDDDDLKENMRKFFIIEGGKRGPPQKPLDLKLWTKASDSRNECNFTLNAEVDTLSSDPKDNLFVRLDVMGSLAFGQRPGDVFIPASTMEALLRDSNAFFSTKSSIAARDGSGDPILLDVGGLANGASIQSNTQKWHGVFISSTGAGSYVPPRALNPKITIFLEWTGEQISYTQFKKLVTGIMKKEEGKTSQTKTNTTVQLLPNGKKVLKSTYFQIGECPLAGYNTWVLHSTFNTFRTQRSEQAVPNASTVQKAQNKFSGAISQVGSIKPNLDALREQVYKDKNLDHPAIRKNYVLIQNKVSATSISTAGENSRTSFPVQAEVWGGRSAADVATDLGWKADPITDGWAISGRGNPEWLHRSAYSWGGIVHNKPGTSQIPENLVVGSYETNSLMTRYESLWQELVRIVCRDKKSSFALLTTENVMKGNIPYLDAKGSWRMASVARDKNLWQPWLCYRLNCSLKLQCCSQRFDCVRFLSGSFFPFQRPFFTSVEARIDKALLRVLCRADDDDSDDN